MAAWTAESVPLKVRLGGYILMAVRSKELVFSSSKSLCGECQIGVNRHANANLWVTACT